MTGDYREISPRKAWAPLPSSEWNHGAARHLLNRIGFFAEPKEIQRCTDEGLGATIGRYFGKAPEMSLPYGIEKLVEEFRGRFRRARDLTDEERRALQREFREKGNSAYLDYGINWLIHARKPENSPFEKLVLFLQNVFVVGLPKVRNPYLLFQHQKLLRDNASAEFGRLCKLVSRSPAMIQYLDLQRSRKGSPNENFARELFELFMLGEGNYTESDIKEAARAFTGYKTDGARYRFAQRQFDDGTKSIFGKRGRFTGDDVIDLALKQPAAETFLPKEFLSNYLSSDISLEPRYLNALGVKWRQSDFNIGFLISKIFSSRLFFHPQFRGNMIKSPTHFYIGLLQDLNLDVAPFPNRTLTGLRNMGQPFYAPPNVRGWVGGKLWINSSTLAARSQAVERVFSEVNEDRLNADDYAELMVARLENRAKLTVCRDQLGKFDSMGDSAVVESVSQRLIAGPERSDLSNLLLSHLRQGGGKRVRRIETIIKATLLSPHYHLC